MAQDQVLTMTPQAAALGVRRGLRRGGVQAIAPQAVLHERDLRREQEAIEAVALTLLQFTPEVALVPDFSPDYPPQKSSRTGRLGASAKANATVIPHSVVLDVTASLRAFGGRLNLCRRVRASLRALGFTPQLSMAPTAMGASLLAVAPIRRKRRLRLPGMTQQLDRLPFPLLPAARTHREWLEGVGCHTLGDLRRLPRAGLQRRCGPLLLEELDRAYGAAPELFDWVEAPPRFLAGFELPDRIEHAEAVLFGARRLLLQMIGWLSARHLAVNRFVLRMGHERGRAAIPPTLLDITLAEAAWQEAHLTRLLKERLGRIVLCAPVISLQLEALQTSVLAPPSASLFPEPGGTPADYRRLLELLTARLGPEAVRTPVPQADYRPEIADRWLPAADTALPEAALPEQGDADPQGVERLERTDCPERPFWLLRTPVALMLRDHHPFYGSRLRLLSSPERIEAGWWDEQFAARDYFVAEGEDAACYWIYRERDGQGGARWFLHGLFA